MFQIFHKEIPIRSDAVSTKVNARLFTAGARCIVEQSGRSGRPFFKCLFLESTFFRLAWTLKKLLTNGSQNLYEVSLFWNDIIVWSIFLIAKKLRKMIKIIPFCLNIPKTWNFQFFGQSLVHVLRKYVANVIVIPHIDIG